MWRIESRLKGEVEADGQLSREADHAENRMAGTVHAEIRLAHHLITKKIGMLLVYSRIYMNSILG